MNRTEQEEYFFGSVLLLANKLQIWGDGKLDDITLKQWFLLLLISKMETDTPAVREIAGFSGTSRQNVKKMLEHLEMKGYVRLSRSVSDARAWSVRLTGKTFDYFTANAEKGAALVNELFTGITDDELEAAVKTADKLMAALEGTRDEDK